MLRQIQCLLRRNYENNLCKLLVSRNERQLNTLYVKNTISFGELLPVIRSNFEIPPEAQLYVAQVRDQMQLLQTFEADLAAEQSKRLSVKTIGELILNLNLRVVQVNKKDSIFYGLSIREFHRFPTRLLPESVSRNLSCIFSSIESSNLTSTYSDLIHIDTGGQFETITSIDTSLHPTKALLKNIELHLQQLKELKKNTLFKKLKSNSFINTIVALMATNWVFLFAVTYGKYGWDVGEPISYLITLAIEILAAIGIFNLGEMCEKNVVHEHYLIGSMNNVGVREIYLKWLICLHRNSLM